MISLDKIQGMRDTMTRKPNHAELFAVATEQHGYFTAEQARSVGVGADLLTYHTKTGHFRRVERGLYRFRDFPPSPHEDVMAAWLAVGKEVAVVSHDSALDIFELSDVIPRAIHLTVPRSKRYLRAPSGTVIHTTVEPPNATETIVQNGIRVTTPTRAILDAAETGTAPEQIEMAVQQALDRGLTTERRLRTAAARRSNRVAQLIGRAIDWPTD
jgi:predicted transcriptional regulator of viral defense system